MVWFTVIIEGTVAGSMGVVCQGTNRMWMALDNDPATGKEKTDFFLCRFIGQAFLLIP
jgi:hypothetical protein